MLPNICAWPLYFLYFPLEVSKRYHSALLAAGVATMLAGLMDCGELSRGTLAALLVFWGWVVAAMVRRPQNPTNLDIALMRWACLPFVIAFDIALGWVWHLRGLLP
jgi:hypothetical protein